MLKFPNTIHYYSHTGCSGAEPVGGGEQRARDEWNNQGHGAERNTIGGNIAVQFPFQEDLAELWELQKSWKWQ